VWSKPLDGLYPSVLNAHAGVLYLSGFGGSEAVEQSGGGKRWQALSGPDSQSAPAFGTSVVCITGVRTGGRTVVNGLEMPSGRVLWERELDGLTQHAPTPAGDVMLVVIGKTSVASNTVLHSLDSESGRTRWSTPLPARTSGPSAPVTGNGMVHLTSGVWDVASTGSMAWTLDLATGSLLWKYPSEGFLGAPVLAGHELHITAGPSSVGADEGHNALITLDAVSGKLLRRAGASSRSPFACFTHPRSPSGLTPRSLATSVTVFSEDDAKATASRLNSAVYRLLMLLSLLTTCDWFLRDHPSHHQTVRLAEGASHGRGQHCRGLCGRAVRFLA